MTKICSKCKVEKELSEFYKDKAAKFGVRADCKECQKKYNKQRYQENKEYYKQYYQNNREEKLTYKKQYHQNNKERENERSRQYNQNHKEEIKKYKEVCKEEKKQYDKQYREDHKKESRQYYQDHKEEKKQYDKQYKQNPEVKQRRNKREKERKQTDPCYCLRCRVSGSIGKALKSRGKRKGGSCLEYLPFAISELKEYLEKQWTGDKSWMNWTNYGIYDENKRTWQIDHIIPHSNFHYTTMDCEEFRKCWSLDNLQPLEAIENIKKGNRRA